MAWMMTELMAKLDEPNTLSPTSAAPGGHAAHGDVAAGRQRVRGVDELRQVIDLAPLRRDRAGVAERLGADPAQARVGAREVLVVNEDVAAVGPDEVRVVGVESVGDPGHLD